MTLNELSDQFETTNTGPLKTLHCSQIVEYKKYTMIQLYYQKTHYLDSDLYKVYPKIEKDCLIFEYLQLCRNFNKFENNLNLPEFLHDVSNNNSSDDEDDNDDNDNSNISVVELNIYDDLNETQNDQRAIKNNGSTKKKFEIFCLANLIS